MELVDLQLVGKEGHPAMSPKEVLERIGYIKPTNVQCKECALILRELFGAHKRINGINKWRIPLRPLTDDYTPINHTDDDDLY